MDVSKFKDGRVHVKNSEGVGRGGGVGGQDVKGLRKYGKVARYLE